MGLRFSSITLPLVVGVCHVCFILHMQYARTDIVSVCLLTVCVSMDGVHGHSSLVQVLISVALLCVPLTGLLVAITGTIYAALVGIRHLYHPVTNRWKQY